MGERRKYKGIKWPSDTAFMRDARLVMSQFSPQIYQCKKCGWAVADGYACGTCGDDNPKEKPQ